MKFSIDYQIGISPKITTILVYFWIDCAVIFVSYLFIYQQINSGAKALSILGQLSMLFAIFTLFHAIGFRIFHTYDGILRYSSFIDLQRVFYAVTFGAVLSALTKICCLVLISSQG